MVKGHKDDEDLCPCCSPRCLRVCYAFGSFLMKFFVMMIVWMTTLSCTYALLLPLQNWLLRFGTIGFLWVTAIGTTINYHYACSLDPGILTAKQSAGWSPSPNELKLLHSILGTNDPWATIREARIAAYCKVCQAHRPIRAHHCSEMGACVVGLDHYCPFVCNGVGHRNRRYFISFLFWASAGLTFVTVVALVTSVWFIVQQQAIPSTQLVVVLVDGIVGLSMGMGVGSLFGYQVWALMRNTGTIEHYDYSRRQKFIKKNKLNTPFIYPWDLGTSKNFKIHFGSTWAEWLLPYPPPTLGDGLNEAISEAFLRSVARGDVHWNVAKSVNPNKHVDNTV